MTPPRLSFASHMLRGSILVLLPPLYGLITVMPTEIRDSYRRWLVTHPALVAFSVLFWLLVLVLDLMVGAPATQVVIDAAGLVILVVLAARYPASKLDEPGQEAP